jgi:DNA helicase HerA-like ATPase
VALGQQGGDLFFGEPAMNIEGLLQVDAMSELFEKLPEVGDQEKPKLVFFFDEAHLLFNDLPSVLQNRIEQVVRLIRSKGVGFSS